MTRLTGIVQQAKQIQLVEPKFDGVAMTTADSLTCKIIGANAAVLTNVAMTYTATLPERNTWGWYANVNLPTTPQTVHIHIEASKSGATGRWHETMVVKSFV